MRETRPSGVMRGERTVGHGMPLVYHTRGNPDTDVYRSLTQTFSLSSSTLNCLNYSCRGKGFHLPQDDSQIGHAVAAAGTTINLEGPQDADETGIDLLLAASTRKKPKMPAPAGKLRIRIRHLPVQRPRPSPSFPNSCLGTQASKLRFGHS